MKSLIIFSLLALCACAPTPTALPEDFNAAFDF